MPFKNVCWIVSCKLKKWVSKWRLTRAYLNCIWIWTLNEYLNGIRVWSVSEMYLRVERFSGWHPCLERIWELNELQDGIRVWCISELYLKVVFEWVSGWHPYLVRIWTVSESWIWMSIRMASVSGAYLNCIWMSDRMTSDYGSYLDYIRKVCWMMKESWTITTSAGWWPLSVDWSFLKR